MEEADDEHDCDGEEDESHGLKGDQLLEFHVVLVDCAAVALLLLHVLVDLVYLVHDLVDDLAVLHLGQGTQVRKLSKQHLPRSRGRSGK